MEGELPYREHGASRTAPQISVISSALVLVDTGVWFSLTSFSLSGAISIQPRNNRRPRPRPRTLGAPKLWEGGSALRIPHSETFRL